jgi:hypothetical protein
MRRLTFSAVLALAFAVASEASAVGPRTFALEGLDRMQGGDLTDVTVAADGIVTAGLPLGKLLLPDATTAFAALDLGGGEALVATAPDGKVFSVKGDTVSLYAETKTLAVTALAKGADGKVYAATLPEGKIFRLERGKAELFSTLPVENAFALVATKQGLFAAGGEPGQVFRIDDRGKAESYWKSEESQIVALAADDAGALYAGSSGKGLLYKISGPGRATVLHDFPGEEVKAIVASKGAVYAVGNEYGEAPELTRKSPGNRAPGPVAGTRARAGKGTLVRIDGNGLVETLWKSSDFGFSALTREADGRLLVGTTAEGRVYRVDDDHATSLLFDGEERQIAAIFPGNDGFVIGSDPVLFRRRLSSGTSEPTWTSKALDAGLVAHFGAIHWEASGAVTLETRSGNSQVPDGTWSSWGAAKNGSSVTSPGARFLQVRARFGGDRRGELRGVNISFQTENARPIVTDVNVSAKGGLLTREAGSGLVASGAEPGKRDATVHVTWKVENLDNDPLRYRVAFRRDGQAAFRDLQKSDEFLTKTEFDWDTSSLAEGRYTVRVEASDDAANPLGLGRHHSLVSEAVIVDNTAPTLAALTLDGRRLRATAKDGTSPVARVEVAVDGRPEFRALAAKDGIFDSTEEAIDADLAPLVPSGAHLVVVRVWDAVGNVATREIDAR